MTGCDSSTLFVTATEIAFTAKVRKMDAREDAISKLADVIVMGNETVALFPDDPLVLKLRQYQFDLLDSIIENPDEDPQELAGRLNGHELIVMAAERGIVPIP